MGRVLEPKTTTILDEDTERVKVMVEPQKN
jgi:hypothetical protein